MSVTGWSRARLATGAMPSPDDLARFGRLVERRRSGEPLQYLERTVQFGPLTLHIDCRAFIPRPETEELYEQASSLLAARSRGVAVDLGTGSGNLALALKHDVRDAEVYGTDLDPEALSLAAENGAFCGLEVTWLEGDLFDALPDRLRGVIDLIASNPPYVATVDAGSLPEDVLGHEPHAAIFAGTDGLDVLRGIAALAEEWLAPGGVVMCEIGADQGPAVLRLFGHLGATVGQDLTGRDRWVVGSRDAV